MLGQETEYALRISSRSGVGPTRRAAYDSILSGLKNRYRSGEARVTGAQEAVFFQNGGCFSYEALPWALDKGLLEGSTPECRGPSQLLIYQRAQERMLVAGLRNTRSDARLLGAQIGLLKNCRDADGHVYGAQENYEVGVASGLRLLLFRSLLLLYMPISFVLFCLNIGYIVLIVALALTLLPFLVVLVVLTVFSKKWQQRYNQWFENEAALHRVTWYLTAPLLPLAQVIGTPFCWILRLGVFTNFRAQLTAFLISRIVFSGAGSLEPDGRFVLAEKVSTMRYTMRTWGTPAAHAIFDTGNLMKRMLGSFRWHVEYLSLFSRRGRMQLGLSDSNRAQTAEYLKIGTTCLIIDMIEAGFLRDAPRLEKPIQALFYINADPSLQSRVMVSEGHSLSRPEGVTALTLQRWYFEKACAFVSEQSTVSLEAREVLRVWEETLQALETSPDSLVGRVDWVTKRWLIAKLAGAEPYLVQKKVDLKYHELGRGYFDELEREGLAPRLVEPAEVEWAVAHPPQKSPAKRRGELIEQLSKSQKILVGWNEIRVGGPLRGKVIRLDDFR